MFRASLRPSSGDPTAFHRVAKCGECCLTKSGNILHTVHTSCHPTLQHHNSYNRTDNYRQWNAVGSPDDGRKDVRNMLRYYWLPINHNLLHIVGFSFTYFQTTHFQTYELTYELFSLFCCEKFPLEVCQSILDAPYVCIRFKVCE